MASASGYNHHRYARAVLKKSRRWEPSLTIQLNHNNWKFEKSAMLFTYDGPMKPFLLALRSQIIPAALIPFLYDIKPPVSFVDGCLVVEIQDMRRTPETKSRVVMRPAAEALAQTVDVMLERRGQAGDERLALELESRIISATSPPLYLGTSILATRNAVLAIALTAPTQPDLAADGTPRSAASASTSSDSSEFERMRRLLRAGDTSRSSSSGGMGVPFQPTWSVLRAKARAEEIEKEKARERAEGHAAQMAASQAAQSGYGGMGVGSMGGMGGSDGGPGGGPGVGSGVNGSGGDKKKPKKKRQAEDEGGPEVKKPKKKKVAAGTAPGGGGAPADGDKKIKIEPASSTTGAGAGATASQDKPKKVKKKKPAQGE